MPSLQIKTSHGIIRATKSEDPAYPGIWLEYIDNEDRGEMPSRFQCLMEEPQDKPEVRILVWDNPNDEDYSQEIINNRK